MIRDVVKNRFSLPLRSGGFSLPLEALLHHHDKASEAV